MFSPNGKFYQHALAGMYVLGEKMGELNPFAGAKMTWGFIPKIPKKRWVKKLSEQ